MKTSSERTESIYRKIDALKKQRRERRRIIAAGCVMSLALILGLVLFLPYPTTSPSVAQYQDSPYYSLIVRINEATYEKPQYKNNFDAWFSQLKGSMDLATNGSNFTGQMPEYAPSDDGSQSYQEVTDNQVAGIIEGDLIKRSDRYIYYLQQNTLWICPIEAENSKITEYNLSNDLPESHYGYSVQEMYLSQDCTTLTLLISCYNKEGTYVTLLSLDVRDPANIRQTGIFMLTGDYLSSRLVDGKLLLMSKYFVASKPDFSKEQDYLPQYGTPGQLQSIPAEDILCPDTLTHTRYTVMTLLDGKTLEIADTAALLSYANNEIYVSQNSIYATRSYQDGGKTMTEIACISYEGNTLEHLGTTAVEGTVKNQYSMDEYEGILRVVTTTSTSASLYCIDLSTMETVASVENFAPIGESAESVRFDGHMAYVCTAEIITVTDPVYFFDLSDLNNITWKDTGTIDGYSTSLVSFGDGFLLGIGYGDDQPTLKIEMYEETASGVASVCKYEQHAEFSEEYKSYLIDQENRLIGLGMYDFNTGEASYVLLHFDGYKLREICKTPLSGNLSYNNDLGRLRAVLIDDYLYLFWDEFKVVKID